MRPSHLINFAFILITLVLYSSCTEDEKGRVLDEWHVIYSAILKENHQEVLMHLDQKSSQFLDKISDPLYLNIDSIIKLGEEYKIDFLLAEYFALGHITNNSKNNKISFLQFLQNHDIHYFSNGNVYYPEKRNTKIEEAPYIALLSEDLGQIKRSWVKMSNEEKLKLDLIYTLQYIEGSSKYKYLKEMNSDKEKSVRAFYWKNEGDFTEEYQKMIKTENDRKLQFRSELVVSYVEQGKLQPLK